MMEVRPTANVDDIKAVLSHQVIWDAIASDGAPSPDEFDWSIYGKWLAIGGYVDGAPVAIMFLHEYADGDKVHIHVLPEYRKEYARIFGEEALKYSQFPAYAEIPDIYPNVMEFAESFGFEAICKIDTNRTKRGEQYTITRYKRSA